MNTTFGTYHKIQSIWKRDTSGRFIPWDWSTPELAYLSDTDWIWTEKVDGTNIRIGLDESGEYRIGGRTDNAQIPSMLLDAIDALDLRTKLPANFDGPVTLFGEGYGAKIQKGGGNYRPDQGFVLFDVKVGDWWLMRDDVVDVASKLGLDAVPVLFAGSIKDAIVMTAPGIQSLWGDFQAEGVVGVPRVPLFARNGDRIICKVKTVDFQRLKRDGIDW